MYAILYIYNGYDSCGASVKSLKSFSKIHKLPATIWAHRIPSCSPVCSFNSLSLKSNNKQVNTVCVLLFNITDMVNVYFA